MNLLDKSTGLSSSLKTPVTSIRISSNKASSPLSSLRASLSQLSNRMTQPRTPSARMTVSSVETPSASATSETPSEASSSSNVYTVVQGFLPAWLAWMVSVKFLLFVLLAIVIFWQFRPYFSYVNDMVNMVKTLLDTSISMASATTSGIVDSTAAGSTVVVDKISGKKKPKASPEPDDANSSVQGGSQGGYCLAGEWKGVRSCVRVNNEKDCNSGKLYDTKDKCVSPELR